jgi:nucleotide-binding universal stress UspA family protein
MSYRNILCLVDGDRGGAPTLDLGGVVAREFGAHLSVVHPALDIQLSSGLLIDPLSGSMLGELLDKARADLAARREAARALFDQRIATWGFPLLAHPERAEGPSASFETAHGLPAQAITERGAAADLILVARPDPDALAAVEVLEPALIETGRPVLIAPDRAPKAWSSGVVAVAWDRSPQASRAVAAALPLFHRARRVVILVEANQPQQFAAAVIDHLRWHGVQSGEQRFDRVDATIGQALIDATHAVGADALVMGGYGHRPLREFLFGGATRTVLKSVDLPVLMAN